MNAERERIIERICQGALERPRAEIFYLTPDNRIMAVPVSTAPDGLQIGMHAQGSDLTDHHTSELEARVVR